MRMRVSIARALVTDPDLLLLDEPFAALDEITRLALNDDLMRLWESHRPTILFVTHSVFESVYLSTRIAVMTRAARADRRRSAGRPAAAARARDPHLARNTPRCARRYRRSSAKRWLRSARWMTVPSSAGCGRDRGAARWSAARFCSRCGRRSSGSRAYRPTFCPGPRDRGELVDRRAEPCRLAVGDLAHHPGGAGRGGDPRRRDRAAVLAVADSGDQPLSLCGDLAGDADRRDRAPDHHLGRKPFLALLVCAWIVAFFPIVANTTVGLNSADRNLLALFRLYGASTGKTLRYLKLPTALPYFLAGLRISGGLALIGAVVAEFVAGTGGAETGLAFRILEAGYRLAIPAPVRGAVSAVGDRHRHLLALDLLSRLLLRHWHESALADEEE